MVVKQSIVMVSVDRLPSVTEPDGSKNLQVARLRRESVQCALRVCFIIKLEFIINPITSQVSWTPACLR